MDKISPSGSQRTQSREQRITLKKGVWKLTTQYPGLYTVLSLCIWGLTTMSFHARCAWFSLSREYPSDLLSELGELLAEFPGWEQTEALSYLSSVVLTSCCILLGPSCYSVEKSGFLWVSSIPASQHVLCFALFLFLLIVS